MIRLNHGSPGGFLDFLRSCAVEGVSSFFWDPGQPVEEEGWAFRSARNTADHAAIVESARPFVDFLAAIGADQLVARPAGSAWMGPPLAADEPKVIGDALESGRCARRGRRRGAEPALRLPRRRAHVRADRERCSSATDPALVGLALDTAELTVGGIDPVAFYGRIRSGSRTSISRTPGTPTPARSTGCPAPRRPCCSGGAGRRIERWFYELGTEGGLVDVRGFVAALREHDYAGWVVVESDHGGNPAELAMLNSWYLQHELAVPRR